MLYSDMNYLGLTDIMQSEWADIRTNYRLYLAVLEFMHFFSFISFFKFGYIDEHFSLSILVNGIGF